MTIDQNHVAQHIPSPQDAEILRLGTSSTARTSRTARTVRRRSRGRPPPTQSSAKISPRRSRSSARSSRARRPTATSSWDLVDAVDKNGKFLEKTTDDKLPAALRASRSRRSSRSSPTNAAKRAELKAKIAKLEAERTTFVAAERAKQQGEEASSLETELMKSTKKVATKKGYKF